MTKKRVVTKMTKKQVILLVHDLPNILAGNNQKYKKVSNIFWGAVAHSLYKSISSAYDDKSTGQADDLGNAWDDLDRRYKAYKIKSGKEDLSGPQRRASKNKNTKGLLTPQQEKVWKKVFATVYYSLLGQGVDEKEAGATAGRAAWYEVKSMGAETKLEVLGDRQVPIMIRSSRLYKSFLPGKFDGNNGYRRYNNNQIYEVSRARLILGSRLPYAKYVAARRPIIPKTIQAWIDKAVIEGRNAIINYLARALK